MPATRIETFVTIINAMQTTDYRAFIHALAICEGQPINDEQFNRWYHDDAAPLLDSRLFENTKKGM